MPPAYNLMTDRTDAGPLIPEDASDEIWKNTVVRSFVHSSLRTRRMTRAQTRIPVLATKATAFWITGDTGLKPTAEIGWENVFINAEEQAAIVYIPDNVVDDADFDLWDEYRPEIEEALAQLSDDTVLFGTGKPSSFPVGIVAGAAAAGNTIQNASTVDWLVDLSNVMGRVEADGYVPDRIVSKVDIKASMRNTRDANKGFLFAPNGPAGQSASTMQAGGMIFNTPLYIDTLGLTGWGTGAAGEPAAIVMDTDAFVIGRRKELAWKTTDTGVITDGAGAIIINLFQQDASALRVTTRWGWVAKNPVNRLQPVKANRYPAGVLTIKVGGGFPTALETAEGQPALASGGQPALTETVSGATGATRTTRTTTSASS
jgi:HK97 family phage major capsid protein